MAITLIPLSRKFRSIDVESRIRVATNQLDNKTIGMTDFKALINVNTLNLIEALGDKTARDYRIKVTRTVTADNEIDLSDLKINNIIKLKDSDYGLIGVKDEDEWENLGNIEDYRESIFFIRYGEIISIFKGNLISVLGTISLYYDREPILVTADTDYIDLKDKYIPQLIELCKKDIYEIVSPTIVKA